MTVVKLGENSLAIHIFEVLKNTFLSSLLFFLEIPKGILSLKKLDKLIKLKTSISIKKKMDIKTITWLE